MPHEQLSRSNMILVSVIIQIPESSLSKRPKAKKWRVFSFLEELCSPWENSIAYSTGFRLVLQTLNLINN